MSELLVESAPSGQGPRSPTTLGFSKYDEPDLTPLTPKGSDGECGVMFEEVGCRDTYKLAEWRDSLLESLNLSYHLSP